MSTQEKGNENTEKHHRNLIQILSPNCWNKKEVYTDDIQMVVIVETSQQTTETMEIIIDILLPTDRIDAQLNKTNHRLKTQRSGGRNVNLLKRIKN